MLTREQKLYALNTVFTPSSPINKRDLFSGRSQQIETIIDAISQMGQHIVIYGERGVGKTSLANMIESFLPEPEDAIIVKVNCDVGMTFETLFKLILSEVSLTMERPGYGFGASPSSHEVNLSQYTNSQSFGPNDLRILFRKLGGKVIIVIDEFDRIEDPTARQLLADTIKNLSDYGIDVTFVLVGVADSVDALIAGHQSVERSLVQIQMPRMTQDELGSIIEKGMLQVGVSINRDARKKIVTLSQGLPHYTHLISLYATKLVLRNAREIVTLQDVDAALSTAIDKAQQSIKDSYHKAISSSKGNLYAQVLLACAMSKVDDMGYFIAADVKHPLKIIMGKAYEVSAFARHISEFCSSKRGPVLKQVGYPRRFRYRFIDPIIAPYIIINGLSKGLINDRDLKS